MNNKWDKILLELSYRVSSGIPDLSNEQHLMKLWDILKEHNWNIDARVELLKNLNELDFKNKEDLAKYAAKHKIRATTVVNVAGEKTTAGEQLPDKFKDGKYIIEPEEAPEKNKDLDQDVAEETTNEFNEGDLSEDGVSDEDFEKNEKIVPVDEPMSLEELESILPKPLPFPKKYVKVLHRLLNTKNKGKITISDFTDAAGGGTLESTAGEIVSMIGMSIDDEEQANKFFDTLEEHAKKNNKGKKNRGIIDPSWAKSARKVRQGIRDRYDRAFGKGNWKLKNSSWDIKEEVEALGVEDYRRDKGFSTDVYFTLEVDGRTILDEVSLKKDRDANLLNSTSGRMSDIIIRGNATAEEYERYDSLYGKLKSEMSADDKKFLKEMEEKYYTEEIPDNVKVSKVKKKQAKMHNDSLSSNNDAIRKDIDNFLSMSRDEQLKAMMNIAKQLNQTPYEKWAENNLEDYKKLFEEIKNTEGTLSLDTIKSTLKKLGEDSGMRDMQKTSASLLVLNPESESSKDFDKIVENSHDHAKATADYLLSNETAREGLLKSIREDFPLQALMSGEESMHLANLSADKDTLKNIFGVGSFKELEQNLKVRETPPPASIVFSVKGKEEIPVSTINTRPDGIGYGQSWKLEMKVHPDFADKLEEQNQKGK